MADGGGAPSPAAAPGRRRIGRGTAWFAALGLLLVALAFVSPFFGTVSIPFVLVARILLHEVSRGAFVPSPCAGFSVSPTLCTAYGEIVWVARTPEVLLGVFVGAALGVSGATLQGVFRNPLADPFLLGLSSGGTLGASLVFVFHVGIADANLTLPAFAFLGAIATGLAVIGVARTRFGSVETLLLTGVAIAYFLSAVLSLVLLSNPYASVQVTFWLLGSLSGATWPADGVVLGILLVAGSLLAVHGSELNLMQLGTDVAQSAGVDAGRVRVRLLLLSSFVTAAAVAFTGIIGFVGLVAPHVVRRLVGVDYRRVIPGSAIVGALILLGARDASLVLFPTSVLPIGIFTAIAGAPVFVYLLFLRRHRSTMGGM